MLALSYLYLTIQRLHEALKAILGDPPGSIAEGPLHSLFESPDLGA